MKRPIPLSKPLGLISRLFAGTLILYILSDPAQGQQVISVKAGMITYTEGEVAKDDEPALRVRKEFVKLKEGQTLRSEMGRAELLLSPNAFLRIGENSSLLLEREVLDDARVVLKEGSALLEIVQAAKGGVIRVRCGASLVEFARAGLYRLDADPGELKVYEGAAKVSHGGNEVIVKRGKMVRMDRNLLISNFDLGFADPLHEWAAQRSFYFFSENSTSGWQMRNWLRTKDGGMYNTGFGIRFFWKYFIDTYVAQQKAREAVRGSPYPRSAFLIIPIK